MTDSFGVTIAPGRFDATPRQAQEAWDYYRLGADLILGTEYGSGKFDRALSARGWDYFRGNGECVVAYRTDVFEPAWKPSADRIGAEFYRGGNHHARTPIAQVPLRHMATGRLLIVRVPHTPAHVQAGDGFRKTTARVIQQGRAWVSALAVLGRRSRRFKSNHPCGAQIIAGDWNVDLHRAHWRAVVGRALGLRCAKPLTEAGDLGKRLVSWAFFWGLVVESTEALEKQEGFDHVAMSIRFTIKEKR